MVGGGGRFAVLTVTIRTVAETGSTNADLLALAGSGAAAEGLWLRAMRQTGGRGRQGRTWESPAGNLYASTMVALRPIDPPAATLSLVGAVALHEAVAAYLPDARPRLKWPNDLLVGGAKLAGMLLERAGTAVVLGIGVNVVDHPTLNRPTTSLAELGAGIDAEALLHTLAEAFARWLARWRGEGLAPVRAAWLAAAHPEGTALSVHLPDGESIDGLFEGLDADGALRLRLAAGGTRVIHAADVFLL